MTYDYVLVGGGLANGLIAYRLCTSHPQTQLLLLEQGTTLGGDHTWSFHAADVRPQALEWLRPFLVGEWPRYEVQFPALDRTLASGYFSIRSERFHQVLAQTLGERVRFGQTVRRVESDGVMLADGTWLKARVVLDGRGFANEGEPRDGGEARELPLGRRVGYQKFFGQDVRLAEPHGLTCPVLMDARCEQREGFRFFYLLPWGERRLLIEDTRYSDCPAVDTEEGRREIEKYARSRGWRIEAIEREEVGSLPIPLTRSFDGLAASAALRVGVRARFFHPTTGYSLPDAVRVAEALSDWDHVSADSVRRFLVHYQKQTERQRWFCRYLNRMLFVGAEPEKRWEILQRFYRLPAGLVERFYASRLVWKDYVRIFSGKPPISIVRALALLFGTRGVLGGRSTW